jgi:SWI/SNF-related matrix-associated actin-dependent regulator 1 of chromatin subfamily A
MDKLQDAIQHIHGLKYSDIYLDDDLMDDLCPVSFIGSKDCCELKSLARIPKMKWNDTVYYRAHTLLTKYSNVLLDVGVDCNAFCSPKIDTLEHHKNASSIVIDDSTINFPDCDDLVKFFDRVDKVQKGYGCPLSLKNIYNLYRFLVAHSLKLECRSLKNVNLFLNKIEDHEDQDLFLIEGYTKQPMPFQYTSILFALLNKQALIADEMGLGKSITALATIQKAGAYGLLIVCPKSLKYKWETECGFVTGKKIEIVDNKTDFTKPCDIYILNYDNVKKFQPKLSKLCNIKSIIFDESHYLKNDKTQRTKACFDLAKGKEFVLQLTGSPVMNRPSELISQIDILGKLALFGGFNEFVAQYCFTEKKYKNRFKDEKREPNFAALSVSLRSYLYIRREKKDILKDLPPKQITVMQVDVPRKHYELLLKNYRAETDLKSKKKLLESLKREAADGKMKQVVERVNHFVENQEKVVVFAFHKRMQEELLREFPDALKIVSEQSDKQRFENATRFQDDASELVIICSIRVAYYGFDLFASSQVIFSEMDWVPEINRQAEDRVHRIGQRDSVNIWYIIAKDTIEENILRANTDKRKVIDKINTLVEEGDFSSAMDSVKDRVIQELDKY